MTLETKRRESSSSCELGNDAGDEAGQEGNMLATRLETRRDTRRARLGTISGNEAGLASLTNVGRWRPAAAAMATAVAEVPRE